MSTHIGFGRTSWFQPLDLEELLADLQRHQIDLADLDNPHDREYFEIDDRSVSIGYRTDDQGHIALYSRHDNEWPYLEEIGPQVAEQTAAEPVFSFNELLSRHLGADQRVLCFEARSGKDFEWTFAELLVITRDSVQTSGDLSLLRELEA